jgi:aspartate-semialdehyde dehydrogenase
VLSALPSAVARDVEADAARDGRLVVSNAGAYRDDPQVPLVIPEVNPDHLALLDAQKQRWPGGIVTNPNCVVAGLAIALAPLHETFGLERVVVTTFQAISGAGRPGPSAFDLVDNVLPYIEGEEPKIAAEPRKILGTIRDGSIATAGFRIGATAVRVPVRHGHLVSVSCALSRDVDPDTATKAMNAWGGAMTGVGLPSAPVRPLEVLDGIDRPQPRLDRDRGSGMTVTVGRVRPCEALGLSFLVLSHNLVRGAAGAALLNAELCRARRLV